VHHLVSHFPSRQADPESALVDSPTQV
jgi:hypothetical protein